MEIDYLIIGGGIAGTTAAETIRSRDLQGSIAIVSGESYRLYSRILLSKPQVYEGEFVGEKLFIKTENWYDENSIQLIVGKRAVAHNPHRKTVTLDDGTEIEYGRMLLAMGTVPHTFEPEGATQEDILQLQTIDDALKLRKVLAARKRVLVVGRGFISFEAAWIAHSLGAGVHVLNRGAYPFSGTVSKQQGEQLRDAMNAADAVTYMENVEIASIQDGPDGREAILHSGSTVPFDVIIAGIGVSTASGWLHRVDRTPDGAALINAKLETNVPSVWAAGDGSVFREGGIRAGNWARSLQMGRVAGSNMAGDIDAQDVFSMVSVFTTQGFGQMLAFVGETRHNDGIETQDENVGEGSVRKFIQGGKIVGAVVLNSPQDVGALQQEILN